MQPDTEILNGDGMPRIDLHWWIFALAGLAVAFIAAISVLYQSIKTARTNPAEALKKE